MKRYYSRSNCIRAARKELEDPMARPGVGFNLTEEGGFFSYSLIDRSAKVEAAPVVEVEAAPIRTATPADVGFGDETEEDERAMDAFPSISPK